ETPNLLSTIGSLVVAAAALLFVVNMVMSLRAGRVAGPNPWDGSSLEWAAASPPRDYNFGHLPVVDSRTPLWDAGEVMQVVHGLRVEERELLLTSVVDAVPEVREPSAEPSVWPLIAALALAAMFISSMFSPWAVVFGIVPVAVALIAWFWPKSPEPGAEPVIE
ncbi:MAG TPA: cytochrome ubiquinol oxidase subunit I, partial [Sphingomicrobium sp.]|nr:cytochrome ubiquinol oxidase subunit I [Sphingomicrobium sp.]